MINSSKQIKGYMTQINKLKNELNLNKENQRTLSKEYSIKSNRIQELYDKINELQKKTSNKIQLTEHAICRYLERVLCLTEKDILDNLLTGKDKKTIEILGGNGKFPVEKFDHIRLVLKDNKIVTI